MSPQSNRASEPMAATPRQEAVLLHLLTQLRQKESRDGIVRAILRRGTRLCALSSVCGSRAHSRVPLRSDTPVPFDFLAPLAKVLTLG
jgi:hypothetical protein